MYYILEIYNNAYIKVATIGKGVSGFRATGNFPINQDKFIANDFIPEKSFQSLGLTALDLTIMYVSLEMLKECLIQFLSCNLT